MPISPDVWNQVRQALDSAQSILITATASADGDSIGAQLALRRLIIQVKGQIKGQVKEQSSYTLAIVNEESCPARYRFLPDAEHILSWKNFADKQQRFDLAFVLDGGSERCGVVKPLFDAAGKRVLVDHHLYGSHEPYEIQLSDAKASSTAEIVFNLLEQYGDRAKLEPAMAAQLYLAMIFDTGFFRFSLTTPKTMRIAAELIATGIDFPKIAASGMVETTPSAKRLLGIVLQKFKFFAKGQMSVGVISRALMKKVSARSDDHERVIEHLCYIEGVEIALLFLEQNGGQVKVSFRSREFADVGEVARSFGGGGHSRASGCTLQKTNLAKAQKTVLAACQTALKQS